MKKDKLKFSLCTEDILRLLVLVAKYDASDDLMWTDKLEFAVICNDIFAWGCADAEDITSETLPELEKALSDAKYDGMLLYCARRRQMRPQGAVYKNIDKKYWSLFNDCGPEREISLGNPQSQREFYEKEEETKNV